MRYDERNMVTERVSTTVPQLYLFEHLDKLLNTLLSSSGGCNTPTSPKTEFFVTLVTIEGRKLIIPPS